MQSKKMRSKKLIDNRSNSKHKTYSRGIHGLIYSRVVVYMFGYVLYIGPSLNCKIHDCIFCNAGLG